MKKPETENIPAVKIWVAWLNGPSKKRGWEEIEEANEANIHGPPLDIVVQFMYECMHIVRWYEKWTGNNHCGHNMPGVFMRIWICMCQDSPNSTHLEGSQEWAWAATLLVRTHEGYIFVQASSILAVSGKWRGAELVLQTSSRTDVSHACMIIYYVRSPH